MKDILLTVAVLAGMTGLSTLLVFLPLPYWIFGVLLCVPFDVGAPVGLIPRLSIVDYFCAAAMMALLVRFKPTKLFYRTIHIFRKPHLMLWILFLLYSGVMAIALNGSTKAMLRWTEFLFVYLIAALACSEEDITQSVAGLLSVLGSLMSVWALAQFLRSGHNYEKTFAIFEHHNGLGAFLSLCLPSACALLLVQKRVQYRILWTAMAFLIGLAFLCAYSRGAWLGILAAVLIVGLLRSVTFKSSLSYLALSFLWIVIATAGPITWVIYRQSKNLPVIVEDVIEEKREDRIFKTSQRMYYWKAATDIFLSHPIIGLGPKNYDRFISEYLVGNARRLYDEEYLYKHRIVFWMNLHNFYLQMLVEYGLIGWSLWALAWSILCIPLVRPTSRPFTTCLIAFQVSGLAFMLHNGVDILFVNSFDIVIAVLLALLAYPPLSTHHSPIA